MFENPRRRRQARNFTKKVPKILDLKSSSEQIFCKNWRWVPLKQKLQEDACHVPYMTSQYETNLWSTHVNIVRLAEPIRRCVRWRTQVFKIEGFVCKRFLPSPPPPPLPFFGSRFISRAAKTENPVPRWAFFAPKLNGNVCYARYLNNGKSVSLLLFFLISIIITKRMLIFSIFREEPSPSSHIIQRWKTRRTIPFWGK